MADARNVDVELETLIRARYPIIYIVSWEERRVEETIREICQKRGKKMLLWTYTTGVAGNVASRDPLQALEYVLTAPDQSVFVFKDFHPFIADVGVTRRLRDLVSVLKTSYKTLIILSPILKLPPELEKEITVVDYQLPTPGDLDRLLEGIIQSVRSNPQVKVEMTPQEREQVIQAASGLTSNEAENVFAKSLVKKKTFDIAVILSEKEQIIRKSGMLEYFPPTTAFAEVGGMDMLKDWMGQRTASFSEKAREYGLPEPRGVLLLGVQGCGKSLTAKAIASLWNLPLLRLDVGKVFAGLVGGSEENMRKAIATSESVAPCVAGDSLITLANGAERTIQSLYDGDEKELEVLAMTPDFRIAKTRVEAVTRRTAPDLFTVRLRHAVLQTTGNHLHPVLRDGELDWTRADELKPGDFIAMPSHIPTRPDFPTMQKFLPADTRLYAPGALSCARPDVQTPQRRYALRKRGADFVRLSEMDDAKTPEWACITQFASGRSGKEQSVLARLPEFITSDIGYLLGLISSDGYLGKNGRVGFVNADLTLHALFAELMQEQFGLAVTRTMNEPGGGGKLSGVSPESAFRSCYASFKDNRLLTRILRAIDERLLEMPAAFLRAYLRGYFDGDGCIANAENGVMPKVTLTVKKRAGNVELRSVLHRVGFPTMNPDSANIELTGWDTVQRFIREIGSCHPARAKRMAAWATQPIPAERKERGDVIPVGMSLRTARQERLVASHKLAAAGAALMHRYEHGMGHPSRTRLRNLVSELSEKGECSDALTRLANLVEGDVAFSPVLSVERAETPEFVYDLVCTPHHNFIVNRIFTHNCILWIDELEKGFSGTQSSGSTDGGTTSRVFGSFLTWLNEKTAPVFVVATSNDVKQLPPELMRKGRFDEIFFIDLPAATERAEIFSIHLKKRRRDPAKFDLERLAQASIGFSGAEIEQAVIAALFSAFHEAAREMTTEDVVKAVEETVPLSVTMAEGVDVLREWAETRARRSSSTEAESTDEIIRAEMATQVKKAVEEKGLTTAEAQEKARAMVVALQETTNAAVYAMDNQDNEDEENEEEENEDANGAQNDAIENDATENDATLNDRLSDTGGATNGG